MVYIITVSARLVTVRCTGIFIDGDVLGECYMVRIRDKQIYLLFSFQQNYCKITPREILLGRKLEGFQTQQLSRSEYRNFL